MLLFGYRFLLSIMRCPVHKPDSAGYHHDGKKILPLQFFVKQQGSENNAQNRNPAKKKRTPANMIFPPRSEEGIENCSQPILIRGYARDHPNAQKKANMDLYLGFLMQLSMRVNLSFFTFVCGSDEINQTLSGYLDAHMLQSTSESVPVYIFPPYLLNRFIQSIQK